MFSRAFLVFSLAATIVSGSSISQANEIIRCGRCGRVLENRPTNNRLAAPKAATNYITCVKVDEEVWQVVKRTSSRVESENLAQKYKKDGYHSWSMQEIPLPPQSRSIVLANDEVAIAIAIAVKGDKVNAVAIGPSGRAEALAVN